MHRLEDMESGLLLVGVTSGFIALKTPEKSIAAVAGTVLYCSTLGALVARNGADFYTREAREYERHLTRRSAFSSRTYCAGCNWGATWSLNGPL